MACLTTSYVAKYTACAGPEGKLVRGAESGPRPVPAPTITLETPRHNEAAPSSLVIVETALDRPV